MFAGIRKITFCLKWHWKEKPIILITGDEDILVLGSFHNTKIIRPKDFEAMLK